MRFMGIDYGMKRIGVAVSDEMGTLAFPKVIILNDSNVFKKLEELIKGNHITEIVVGESLDLSGEENALQARIGVFIDELHDRFNLPVRKQKEFLTSVEARKSTNTKSNSHKSLSHSKQKAKKSEKVDAGAAALILQRYLDRRSKKEQGGLNNKLI